MIKTALAKLNHRSEQLRARVRDGTGMEIRSARELMRLSLIELYKLGYWREHAGELDGYMLIYRSSDRSTNFSVKVSMPVLGRMVRYSP